MKNTLAPTYWFDPPSYLYYRAIPKGNGWEIENQEPGEAKWYQCEATPALETEAQRQTNGRSR